MRQTFSTRYSCIDYSIKVCEKVQAVRLISLSAIYKRDIIANLK